MLESLVSSRIRRTLLEHLLTHPTEPVYLRGLAKQLGLSISPLRRELKRLEQAGMLKAADEGPLRIYRVDQASPLFAQLQPAFALPRAAISDEASGQAPAALVPAPSTSRPAEAAGPVRSQRRWPMAITLISVATAVVVVIGVAASLSVMNRRLTAVAGAMIPPPGAAAVGGSAPRARPVGPAPGGGMSSSRWQVLPGTMGGFAHEQEPAR